MSTTFTELVTLESANCCTCGVTFAMPANLKTQFRQNGGKFYCPNGHPQCYGEPEVARLRKVIEKKCRELTTEKCETLWVRLQRDEQIAAKQLVEKKLRRVGKGVCPCCNRTFTNLARHMETKHSKPETT